MRQRTILALVPLAAGVVLVFQGLAAGEKEKSTVNPKAVDRARKMVSVLDEVYKQTIVLITDKYVHDEDDFPAGSAAVELFRRISENGSHNVRLIDATGEPYVDTNVAKDDFERDAIKKLKDGKDRVEEIITADGKAYLRTLTPVPVVMAKCVMCHPHYEDAKKGEPIGAISYKVLIE